MTFQQAWALYFANHPDVAASWGHQNNRWPSCSGGPCGCPDSFAPVTTEESRPQ